MNKQILALVCFFALCGVSFAADKSKPTKIKETDMLRKSIVYDKDTPHVFYCATSNPGQNINKLIVTSRPLKKLCEYEGQPLPEDYKSDCYNDVDESSYACKEKLRIMKRIEKEPMEDI